MGAIMQAARARSIAPAQSSSITFTDSHGDAITVSSDDVRRLFCPKADDKEIALFLELCRAQRLNPFLSEAYLVKFGSNPAQIMVAHKALVKRAEAHEQYDGMEHGVVVMRNGEIHKERRGAFYPEAGETLLGGWAEVRRKDRSTSIYAERSLRAMNKNQANWKSMPDVMIDKCAQAAALREAFPDELGGMYAREEMGQTVEATVEEAIPTAPTGQVAQAHADLTEEDMEWLREATARLVSLGYAESETKAYLWEKVRTEGLTAAHEAAQQMESSVVMPDTGEVVDMADADIEFGE